MSDWKPHRFRVSLASGDVIEVVWTPGGLDIVENGKQRLFPEIGPGAEYVQVGVLRPRGRP